jgi:hypothetical protein
MPGARSSIAIFGVMPIFLACRLRVLTDQLAGLQVVGGEQRVGRVLRLGRRVERDHEHAGVARLLDRRDDRLRVGRDVEDDLRALRRHVLHRGDLAGVVGVRLAGGREQLDVVLLGLGLRALLHLHEERVGLRLRDEADGDLFVLSELPPPPPLSSLPQATDTDTQRRYPTRARPPSPFGRTNRPSLIWPSSSG